MLELELIPDLESDNKDYLFDTPHDYIQRKRNVTRSFFMYDKPAPLKLNDITQCMGRDS